jgi:hypothetical protein
MAPELSHVQQQLNLDYLKSNAAARNENWLALESDEARAEMDPTRFLRKEFVDVNDRDLIDKVIVLRTHARFKIHEAAEPLGLQHESTDAPLDADGSLQFRTDGLWWERAKWLCLVRSPRSDVMPSEPSKEQMRR